MSNHTTDTDNDTSIKPSPNIKKKDVRVLWEDESEHGPVEED